MKRAANPKQELRPTYIRQWREYRGLSQDRLVERMREFVQGFSKSTLSRIENSKQAYTQHVLEALANALNCEPADLIMRDPNSKVWTIMDTLRQLPPEKQEVVAAMIEGLKTAA